VTEVRVIDIRYSVDDIWDKIIGQIAANGEKLRFVHKDLELVKSHSFDHKLVVLEID
jgi:hypothetical protein